METGYIWELSVLPAQFFFEPKTALKNWSPFKRGGKGWMWFRNLCSIVKLVMWNTLEHTPCSCTLRYFNSIHVPHSPCLYAFAHIAVTARDAYFPALLFIELLASCFVRQSLGKICLLSSSSFLGQTKFKLCQHQWSVTCILTFLYLEILRNSVYLPAFHAGLCVCPRFQNESSLFKGNKSTQLQRKSTPATNTVVLES